MRAQIGPARACGGGAGWVEPRARPNPVDSFFFEFICNAKIISRKVYKLLKGTKNTPKITKIPGKFLEMD
jgi:hypothetical protein